MRQQDQQVDTIIGYGGKNMNNNFIQWLQKQKYYDMNDEELGPCSLETVISISELFECKWRPMS